MKEVFEIFNHLSPSRTVFYCVVFLIIICAVAHVLVAALQTVGVIFKSIFAKK